jgi:3-phenylpropionate/trans-cinnamate dioxygenase ferredoxin reductase component
VTAADRVVIVGAGHAGTTAATVLRQHGFEGEVVLLSAERHLPYDRPPLSKGLFKGHGPIPLLAEEAFAERDIDLRLGIAAKGIDRSRRVLELEGGEEVEYGTLVLATGAIARDLPVPGVELDRVHRLRVLDDARRLEEAITPASRLAIIGGGWIGLEAAAAAIAAGHRPTVIEREERLLARVASAELSALLDEVHRERGTEVMTGAAVEGLRDGRGAAAEAVLVDGAEIECDHVLVGVGAVADDSLARAAGLRCEDGIVVDEDCRTEDPHIAAIGDVTRRPLLGREDHFRLESIPSAQEQARRLVTRLLGGEPPAAEVPWFWSDQFDLKVQIAGLAGEADEVVVIGDPEARSVCFCHLREGLLTCVEAVNERAGFRAGKAAIAAGGEFDPSQFGAPQTSPTASEEGGEVPVVVFRQLDGSKQRVEVPLGSSLMNGAIEAGVPGIIAECGGGCACGTCHVVVAEGMLERLGERSQDELDMLEFVEGSGPNSRLSCQVTMTAELDGLELTVPEQL